MQIISLLAFVFIGVIAGTLAGLLGISGGIVTVPSLYFIFRYVGFAPGYEMHLAIGTSLAAMTFNGIASTLAHEEHKAVLWNLVLKMGIGIILGTVLGSQVAHLLPGNILEILFGFFLLLVGLYFLRKTQLELGRQTLPGGVGLSAMGFGIGSLSSMLGIGGGIITVPLLMHCQVPHKKAIACSAATGTLISFMGALSFLYFGWKTTSLPFTVGFIYLPAFFIVGIFSFLSAKYGVKLAYFLSDQMLRKIFAVVLIGIGLLMMAR